MQTRGVFEGKAGVVARYVLVFVLGGLLSYQVFPNRDQRTWFPMQPPLELNGQPSLVDLGAGGGCRDTDRSEVSVKLVSVEPDRGVATVRTTCPGRVPETLTVAP